MISALSDTIEKLKHVNIDYGIFGKYGAKLLTVRIKNPNDSVTEHQIKASDALYLLDKGTVLYPAKQLLQRCKPIIQKHFTIAIANIITNSVNHNIVPDFSYQLSHACHNAELEIRRQIFNDDKDKDLVQKLLTANDNIIPLNDISKYIQVKYIIK